MQGQMGYGPIDVQPMRGQLGRAGAGRAGRQTGRGLGRRDAGRGGRFTGRAGVGLGRAKRIVYPYASIAPKIIRAIAAMPGDAPIKLLKQLAAKRADLVGYLTIAIANRDPKLGNSLLMRQLTNQKQIRDYPDQFLLLVKYLPTKPSRQSLKLLEVVISKSRQQGNRAKAVDAIKTLLQNAEKQELQIDASDALLASLKSCMSRGLRHDANLAKQLIDMLKQWRNKPRIIAELKRLSKSRDQQIAEAALEALQ